MQVAVAIREDSPLAIGFGVVCREVGSRTGIGDCLSAARIRRRCSGARQDRVVRDRCALKLVPWLIPAGGVDRLRRRDSRNLGRADMGNDLVAVCIRGHNGTRYDRVANDPCTLDHVARLIPAGCIKLHRRCDSGDFVRSARSNLGRFTGVTDTFESCSNTKYPPIDTVERKATFMASEASLRIVPELERFDVGSGRRSVSASNRS